MYDIEFIVVVVIAILEVIISLSMTGIFVLRLYSLILMQTVHHYDEAIRPPPGSPAFGLSHKLIRTRTQEMSVLEESKHHRMLRISVKTAILTFVSLTSSSTLMALRAAKCYEMHPDSLVGRLSEIWMRTDTMISCICLVLFLPRTQWAFNIFCGCCNRILSGLMRKSLQKSTVRSLYEIESSRHLVESSRNLPEKSHHSLVRGDSPTFSFRPVDSPTLTGLAECDTISREHRGSKVELES